MVYTKFTALSLSAMLAIQIPIGVQARVIEVPYEKWKLLGATAPISIRRDTTSCKIHLYDYNTQRYTTYRSNRLTQDKIIEFGKGFFASGIDGNSCRIQVSDGNSSTVALNLLVAHLLVALQEAVHRAVHQEVALPVDHRQVHLRLMRQESHDFEINGILKTEVNSVQGLI